MSDDGNNEKRNDSFAMSDVDTSLPAAAAALSAEDRADLVNALKDKLQSLAGQHSNILETLSHNVRKRVEFLREIQSQHDKLEAEFIEERRALEAKYEKFYEPLYTKRFEIVNGVQEGDGITNEDVRNQEGEKDTEEKGIPGFWLTAMKNNEAVGEEIMERDEGALKFLKDIKWCRIDDPEGFKLEFYFEPNPYFKNSVLTKTYQMIDDDDDPILQKTIGTEIEWHPGKCLTKKVLKKKPKKGSKNAKPITKIESCASFFNFFNTSQIPEEAYDLDEDAIEEIQDRMERDYNVGTTIRDKIIHHAVSWFTGEAAGDDELDAEDDDDDDVDDGEDEDEDDDSDEDDAEDKNGSKKAGRAPTVKSEQAERVPQCKQQ
ncbi:nucleosome assembly protein 1;4 [Mercurialis annua]|uniref:nucleosome assembly protein 1;4 n=1 Tax=Mercurialis annua TaxID=3986 RepID=UPI00215E1602|nr:nucleosome assembly protein 1;4 [Mercurialis annua]